MNKISFSLIAFLSFSFLVYSQKELTDKGSPSYVPFPYPKNDEEVIEDLLYALNLHYGAGVVSVRVGNSKSLQSRRVDRSYEVLREFGSKRSGSLNIGKIHRIKHRTSNKTKDYFYIIELLDSEKNVAFRVSLDASGLFMQIAFANDHPLHTVKDEEIKNGINEVLVEKGIESEIKSMDTFFVSYQNVLSMIKDDDLNTLVRKVTLANGGIYYVCSGLVYGNKEYTHFMALYKLYERQVVKGVMKSFDFYKHIKSTRSRNDVRIDNTLKGEFLYLSKVGDMFKYNYKIKNKTVVFQRNIK